MQISRNSLPNTIRETIKESGFRGFYAGWSAGFLRQITYSTARLGIYSTLYDLSQSYFGLLNFPMMVGLGMISGIAGAFIGTPADLILIRMIADTKLPPEKRWNYRNSVVALFSIWKTGGIRELWRGAVPTVARAAIVNGTQLGTYSQAKLTLQETGHLEEGLLLQFYAAMISGLAMCTTSLPVDVAKTRIQNWDSPTKAPGIVGMVINVAQKEGIPALWRGFVPYYSRSAPSVVITMLCLDQLHRLYIDLFAPSK